MDGSEAGLSLFFLSGTLQYSCVFFITQANTFVSQGECRPTETKEELSAIILGFFVKECYIFAVDKLVELKGFF